MKPEFASVRAWAELRSRDMIIPIIMWRLKIVDASSHLSLPCHGCNYVSFNCIRIFALPQIASLFQGFGSSRKRVTHGKGCICHDGPCVTPYSS
jgi:hypothetical protein